jgi:hypothetical protein
LEEDGVGGEARDELQIPLSFQASKREREGEREREADQQGEGENTTFLSSF